MMRSLVRVSCSLLVALAFAPPAVAADAPKAAPAQAAAAAPALPEAFGVPHYVPPASYSEDLVITTDEQNITLRRAIDGPRTRTEMSANGQSMIMIELGDERGTSYQIMPDRKQAMKMSRAGMDEMGGGHMARAQAEHEKVAPAEAAAPPDAKMEDLGDETIDGTPARKVRLTSADGEVLAWFDKATGAPLKMQSTNDGKPATIEWKNRKLAPQPAELFEVPKSYKLEDMDEMMAKMKSMGGMRGMAGGMMGGMAQGMGSSMGASLGASLGASVGGPLGAMAGQYIGGRVGGMIGRKAADVVR